MKSRSREVNIFNMSLLDILCGALGAFCFMMLVLMPSYQKAAGSTDDVQQLKMAKEKAEQEAKSAQEQAQQAKQEAEQAQNKLDVGKRPMVVEIQWNNPEDEINMYVRFKGRGPNASAPPFNPEVRPEATYAGDSWFSWGNHEFWIIRDAPVAEYEIYYRIAKRSPQKQPIYVSGVFGSAGTVGTLPGLTLDGTQKGVFVGTIVRTPDQKLTFRGKGDK